MDAPDYLQELRDLDKTSPQFSKQLCVLLRRNECQDVISALQGEDLTWFVEYVDGILINITNPANPEFKELLHEFGRICGANEILPRSFIHSSSLRDVHLLTGSEDVVGDTKLRVKHVRVRNANRPRKMRQSFCRAAAMGRYLSHPNIVSLLGATIDPLQLVSDWIPDGDLLEYMIRHPDADRQTFLSDVAEGLNYLHSCDIIHGALKAANILVDVTCRARITDYNLFALTQETASTQEPSWEDCHGARWMAPEILDNRGTYSTAGDVFSFSMVIIEAFTSTVPFSEKSLREVILAVIGGVTPPRPTHEKFTDELWVLTQKCWEREARQRPSSLEILRYFRVPAWSILTGCPLDVKERTTLVSSMVSDHRETEAIKTLSKDDAQSLVTLMDEVLNTLESRSRRRCSTILRKLCGRHRLLPRSMEIPVCYDRSGLPLDGGGYSEVWKGRYDGRDVAVKVLKVYTSSNIDKIARGFCKEVMTWKALRNPNILPLLGVKMAIHDHHFAMVSEWMVNGNIIQFVRTHGDVNRFELLKDVAQGLIYMHGEEIVHGDLKGANILIDECGHVRLADFGLIAIIPDLLDPTTSSSSSTKNCGTIRWMSPELFDAKRLGLEDLGHTKESDCYALGMVIYEVLSGRVPFARHKTDAVVVGRIMEGERPEKPEGPERVWFTNILWEELELCWSPHPKDRPKVEAIFNCLGRVSTTWELTPEQADNDLRTNPSTEETQLTSFPPINERDFVESGIDANLVPSIFSAVRRAEQMGGETQLQRTEVEDLVNALDKILSSDETNPGLKTRCYKLLRKVSLAHGIIPSSYFLTGLTLSDDVLHTSGGIVDVWRGRWNGQQVVVKAFNTKAAEDLERIKRDCFREVTGWKCVTHPNLLPLLGVSTTLFAFCIVNPWMPNGSIIDYIRKDQRTNRIQLLAQAACGLQHLHSLGIVHGSISPGNILISEEGVACLGDFGVASTVSDHKGTEPDKTVKLKPGAVRYIAPELLNPSKFHLAAHGPTRESDIYSFAMTTYEALTEAMPFGDFRDSVIMFHIKVGDRPLRPQNVRWLPDEIWHMITICWSEQREERWDAHAVHRQLSVSNVQEVAGDSASQTITLALDAPENPRERTPVEQLTILVEDLPNNRRRRNNPSQLWLRFKTASVLTARRRHIIPIFIVSVGLFLVLLGSFRAR